MPSAIVKTLYFDLDKLAWTLTAGGNALLQPLTIGQNDTIDFNVQFIKGGVAQTLTAPAWSAGIKVLNGFSNSYVVQFGAPTGTPPTYTFTGTISSTELSAALLTDVQFALEFRDSTNGIVTLPALTLNIAASYTITGTTPTSANGTLNVAAGKTVTFPNTLTFPSAAGTNGQQLTLSNSTTGLLEWAASGSSGLTVGTTTITSGTTTRVLYDNAGVVGEYAISGTGSVAMTGDPVFTNLITVPYMDCTTEIQFGASATGLSYIDDSSANIITVTVPAGAFGTDKTQTLQNATGTIALTSDITGGTLAGSFLTLAVNGKSLTLGANLTTTGTDLPTFAFPSAATARTYTFPTTAATLARTDAGQTFTATSGTPNTFAGSGNTVRFDTGVVFTYDVTVANAYANVFLTPGGVSGTAAAPVFRIWAGGTGTGMYGTGYENLSFTTASTRRGGWSSTGAFDLTGTLAVTGATTLTGLLTANGGITVVGGAKLLTTNTALTDNAGANTATLDNSPITGNPTKWIAINDNGTTRYIPTWS
jgi:hypothetical protein